MKAKPLRTILGFYSNEEGEPEKAQDALRTLGGRYVLFRSDGTTQGSARQLERYSSLRLEGESLVVAEVGPSEVEAVVKRLEGAGSPAVFVVREDLAGPSSPNLEPAAEFPDCRSPDDFARQCALRRDQASQATTSIFSRLRENERTLDAARRDLAEASRLGHPLTAAAEWMLDNAFLIRTHIAEINRNLPRNYRKTLPVLAPGYELARQLVACTDHPLNEVNISDCLRDYQTVAPLTIAELWFFPLLLRMALIEELRQLALRVNRTQQLREAAYLWANRLAAGARRGTEEFEHLLGRMEVEPVALQPYFVTSLVEQLQDEENALAPIQHWIEERLNQPLTELVRSEHNQEAAERISTANAFGSLRALSQIDFSKIFEAVSLVEAELRSDTVYASSDFATRDQCRRVVEGISRHSGADELEVARRAVELATQPGDPQTREAPYYLLAEGVTQLEAEVKAKVPFRTRFIRALRRRATSEYLGAITVLTACFLALALALAWEGGVRREAMFAILAALALFPLSELSIQIINALVISLLPPALLPKMDFKEGIPPEHATLVVVPMMLSSLEVVHSEVEKLEVRFLANREANLFFGLFSDFTDSPAQTAPGDAELLRAEREGIAGLNSRYPGGRFVFFIGRASGPAANSCGLGGKGSAAKSKR